MHESFNIFLKLVVEKMNLNADQVSEISSWIEVNGTIDCAGFMDSVSVSFFSGAFGKIVELTGEPVDLEIVEEVLEKWVVTQKGWGVLIRKNDATHPLSSLPRYAADVCGLANTRK